MIGDHVTEVSTGAIPTLVTIGIAVEVPEPWASEIKAARLAAGDEKGRHTPTHITLLGPTLVSHEGLAQLHERLLPALSGVNSFDVHLQGSDSFRPVTPVVFLRVDDGAAQLAELAELVRTVLEAPDPKYDFHPHVTLGHEIPEAALDRLSAQFANFELDFQVATFRMYIHGSDGHWRLVHEYHLPEE